MTVTAADAIEALLPALPERTTLELRRLLSYELAAPHRTRARYARLGLLWELLERGSGEVPDVAAYEKARKQRSDGDGLPSAAQLSRVYGGWYLAVRAALALGESRGRRNRRPRNPERRYTAREALNAIEAFRGELGYWPPRGEYERWSDVRREAEARWGIGYPQTPTVGVFRVLFGSWTAAIAAARRTTVSALNGASGWQGR